MKSNERVEKHPGTELIHGENAVPGDASPLTTPIYETADLRF